MQIWFKYSQKLPVKFLKTSFLSFFRCVRAARGRCVFPIGLRYNHGRRGAHFHQEQHGYPLPGNPVGRTSTSVRIICQKLHLKTIIKLFTDQLDLSALPAEWSIEHVFLCHLKN